MNEKKIRIAVDGPAASGKGTAARGLARRLGYSYVDTGTMYRAVALAARRRGVALDDEASLVRIAGALEVSFSWNGGDLTVFLDGRDVTEEVRAERTGQDASKAAAMGPVRAALLARQRRLAEGGGVVMDGRDVGSVVIPDAELKVYLDASVDERARRRQAEMEARGVSQGFDELKAEMARRDALDRTRSVAPLTLLPDAHYIDTTGMDPGEVVDRLEELVRERTETA